MINTEKGEKCWGGLVDGCCEAVHVSLCHPCPRKGPCRVASNGALLQQPKLLSAAKSSKEVKMHDQFGAFLVHQEATNGHTDISCVQNK